MEPFHDRMPVILTPADYDRWLAPADPARLPIDLLRPFPEDKMVTWKVSTAVGNVKNDEPGLIAAPLIVSESPDVLPAIRPAQLATLRCRA